MQTVAGPENNGQAPSHSSLRTIFSVAVVLLVVLAGVAVWYWRTHPAELPVDGFSGKATRAVDHSLYFALSYPDDEYGDQPFTIHSITAETSENSADSELAFFVCHLDADIGYGAIGSIDRPEFERACPDAQPVKDGETLDPGAKPVQQLLLAVTPRSPGLTKIRSLKATYSRGWQRGTQSTDANITVRAR